MHAKYVAIELAHLNHVAKKKNLRLHLGQKLDALGACTCAALPNFELCLFSSISDADCDIPMSTHTNWRLGGCAIYGQSPQIVIENRVTASSTQSAIMAHLCLCTCMVLCNCRMVKRPPQ